MSYPAGDATKLAEGPLAAAVAETTLSHFLLITNFKKLKYTFHYRKINKIW
jgi:hypothetical protein